jgi:hypothetical protein
MPNVTPAFAHFMTRALLRAAYDTAHYFGINARGILTSVLFIGLGFLLHYRVRGGPATKDEMLSRLVLDIAPALIFFAALFLYNCVRAPYLIYAEDVLSLRSQVATADSARDTAREEAKTAKDLAAKSKGENDELKERLNAKCSNAQDSTTGAPPQINAIRADKGKDENGLYLTEFTLIPNKSISAPALVELEFDYPILGLGTVPSPPPSALLGGGDRWDGTHGYATLPSLGMSPSLVWIVTVKSRVPIHLTKPPHLRVGY